jgi:hypothetical protein
VEEKDRLGSVLVRVDDIGGHLEEELTCKLQHGKNDTLDKKLTADGSILVLRAKRVAQPPPGNASFHDFSPFPSFNLLYVCISIIMMDGE